MSRSFGRGKETLLSFFVKADFDGAVGVTSNQREAGRVKKDRVAQSSKPKTGKSPRDVGLLACPKGHQHFANRRGDGAQCTPPSQLPMRKPATNPQTKLESGTLPPKVTSGTTVAFSDSRDQCSIAPSDRAAGSVSAPAPEPPSRSVSGPMRRTRPMEANGRGSKRTKVARRSMSSELPAHSSAMTHTPSYFASSGTTTDLDRDLAHIGAMAQECYVRGLSAPVYSFDNPAENMPEDENDPYDITMASEYPSTVHVGSEKEPEAAVFPKPLLPVTPPIWAEVGRMGYDYPDHVGNMVSSHDRKCASPLTPSGAFKAVFIKYTISSRDTFLAGIPPGLVPFWFPANLADKFIVVIYSTTAEGLSSRMGKGFYIPTSMFIEAESP